MKAGIKSIGAYLPYRYLLALPLGPPGAEKAARVKKAYVMWTRTA